MYLTKAKAAEHLSISLTSLDELIKQGRIKVVRISITRTGATKDGRPRKPRPAARIDADELTRFMRSCELESTPRKQTVIQRRQKPERPLMRLAKDYV